MKDILRTIEIPKYIKRVKLSNKRKPTYYKKTSKKPVPKKYKDLKFVKGVLVHPDGVKVVANSRSVGTPRFKKINGQEIYSGMPHHMRAKIVKEMKESFKKHLKDVEPITEFPIQIEVEIHTTIEEGNWDLDNLWIYNKCFQDALADAGIIPDDNIQYITKPGAPEFIPIADEQERKLVWKLYKDDRKVIADNPYYQGENRSETW